MISLPFLKDRKVAVLGLGKTGLPAALALRDSGAAVLVWDDNPVSREQATRNRLTVADFTTAPLAGIEFLLLSPGIPHSFPAPHPVVARFKQAGIPLISDIELLRRAEPAATVVAITGTNGKSTTTALIGHILASTGRSVQVGGNLGPAVLGFAPLGSEGIYVLELSSYQLELTPSLNADIAILLNITPDHLDRHGGMAGYVTAKANIFQNAGTAIIGVDDEYCRGLAQQLTKNAVLPPLPAGEGWGEGLGIGNSPSPTAPKALKGQGGVASPAGRGITLSLNDLDATVTFADGILRDRRTNFTQPLAFPALPGPHNAQNAAAAYAACLELGLSTAEIVQGLASFPGLAHRQQRIATVNGVAYVNDSKATNADAAAKALACYENIYWIAGGQPKEGGLTGLEALLPRIRHAFLIGEAANEFGSWLAGRVAYSHCGTLDRAVAAAQAMAETEQLPGATVLLSPACASWDQFQNFEHRGEVFTALVQKLAEGVAA